MTGNAIGNDSCCMPSAEDITRGEADVRAFIARHPEYAIDDMQPAYRGGTNCCTFGHRGSLSVVFKSFTVPARWRNEVACLRMFAPTGLVPELLAEEPERLILMTFLEGKDIGALGASAPKTEDERRSLSNSMGVALGELSSIPPLASPSGYNVARDFSVIPWQSDLRAAIAGYTTIARRVQRSLPVYADAFFERSLSRIEREVDRVGRQPLCLYHEDISNARIAGDAVVGFYDFEMCRLGTHAMQLGVATSLCGPGKLEWAPLRAGFEERTRRKLIEDDLHSILAMAHLYAWIHICYWGWWDGDPGNTFCMNAVGGEAGYWREFMAKASHTVLGSADA